MEKTQKKLYLLLFTIITLSFLSFFLQIYKLTFLSHKNITYLIFTFFPVVIAHLLLLASPSNHFKDKKTLFLLFIYSFYIYKVLTLNYDFLNNSSLIPLKILFIGTFFLFLLSPLGIFPILTSVMAMLNLEYRAFSSLSNTEHILALLVFSHYIVCLSFKKREDYFWKGVLLLCSSCYLLTGFKKIFIADYDPFLWANQSNILLGFIQFHTQGWLNESSFELMKTVSQFNKPLHYFALALELVGPFTLLTNHRIRLFTLSLLFLFHLGVFFLIGCAFWQWAFVLIGLLIFMPKMESLKWFSFAPLITTMLLYFLPYRPFLGWWWSPHFQTFVIEGVVNEKRVTLSPKLFQPYNYIFDFAQLHSLFKGPSFPNFMIEDLSTLSSLKKKDAQTKSLYDPSSYDRMKSFLESFNKFHNKRYQSLPYGLYHLNHAQGLTSIEGPLDEVRISRYHYFINDQYQTNLIGEESVFFELSK